MKPELNRLAGLKAQAWNRRAVYAQHVQYDCLRWQVAAGAEHCIRVGKFELYPPANIV
jgi:hypothetical protein